MLRTVEETSKELNVSKTAIYNKLKLKEFKDKIVKKQGVSMVDDTLFNLIKDSLKFKQTVETEETNNTENPEIAMDEDSLMNLNRELIHNLLDQLKEKDKQISELHNLIQNSQVLLKEEKHKAENQLYLQDHFQEVDTKLQDIREKMLEKKNNKHTLLDKIFKKHK